MSAMIWLARLLAVFRKPKLEEELNEEIRSHLEMATGENLRHGMNLGEARGMAERSFGPVEPMKEEYRDTRGVPIIESGLQGRCGRQPANYLDSTANTQTEPRRL